MILLAILFFCEDDQDDFDALKDAFGTNYPKYDLQQTCNGWGNQLPGHNRKQPSSHIVLG